jgi:radical SAM enzyme (TIGR01210 family)
MPSPISNDDIRVRLLQGDRRTWWDVTEKRFVPAVTVYIPFGCPDWGETEGKRNRMCTFCDIPNAAIGYREGFNDGKPIPDPELIAVFQATLRVALEKKQAHTVMVFNAGSFLAMCPEIQNAVMEEIVTYPLVRRLVVESRAGLITDASLLPLTSTLRDHNIALTIRIGVETQDDHLRLSVLYKGHTRKQLETAMDALRSHGVTAGGYVLLNPSPGLNPVWAIDECLATFDFVLGTDPGQLGMQETYFCSTNVGGPLLREAWEAGEFAPATLWMVYDALTRGILKYGSCIHLLPFKDEPELVAVPSNHVLRGIPQNLDGAEGCDRAFHAMFDRYRETMDPAVLVPPPCSCRPQ